ncbi:alpha/beta hydrolase [Streptomyces sp. YIM 98790]|uniref:alpha/beta hydrolase n=1 Tax=Streptomyces sp. YIM 98790 TaxID=2689077 RepID=UPI0014091603|nr:alpha/beta hydrolase [Streptomyces sp. YIM 98790]
MTGPMTYRAAGRPLCAAVLAALLFAALTVPARSSAAHGAHPDPGRIAPVVFVHGQQGSAQQWQSQAKRFSSNGYPDSLLHAYEYDTTVPTDTHAIEGLETFIDAVLARTGAAQVDVVAHSRGTRVMHAYLADPARAAEVRRYVNLDGRSADAPPGGVPTLALWGSLQPNGSIGGAVNIHQPDKGHTETATSAEGFAHIHRFLRGREPLTTRVLPQPPGLVRIEGKVVSFPQNTGLAGRLEVWRVDPATGARQGHRPRHAVRVGADGSFGPLPVHGLLRYELAFVREGERTSHFYTEPFERSDRFLRLLVSPPGGVADFVDACPGHTSLTVSRQREWWSGSAAGTDDSLRIDGTEVLSPGVAPPLRQILGVFVFDRGCDGVTELGAALPPFDRVPFLTAADLYLPAAPEADGTLTVAQTLRGTGETRTLAVPNWPSDRHTVSVQFKDYPDTVFGRGSGGR